jgi:hypothetical protein
VTTPTYRLGRHLGRTIYRNNQLIGVMDTPEDGRLVVDALNQAEPLTALVRDLYDDGECWYDHHGYCQGHGWTKTDPTCPHARAKTLLAVGAEPEDVTRP